MTSSPLGYVANINGFISILKIPITVKRTKMRKQHAVNLYCG